MRGPLAYVGGKSKVARRLVALFPPHRTYIELFCGAAQVLFAKERSEVEIVNDLDTEVVTFLRVAQHHSEELIRQFSFTASSRKLHEIYRRQDPETLTDVQRAARFLYLQRTSFGGRVTRQNFHFSVTQNTNFNPSRLKEVLMATARRLERVQIEQRAYEEMLERFDRPETFFFCDPPYIGRKWYRFNLADEEYGRLAERLAGISGKFLLTINDSPLSRKVFSGFNTREHSFFYSCTRSVPKVRELLVANYPLPS